MKVVCLTFLVLLAASIHAADWSEVDVYTDTIQITALPYTISADSTYYTLSGDLHADTCGIYISSVSYVRIEGAGDSIVFDDLNTGKAFGIKVRRSDHVVLKDLIIVQDITPSEGDSGSWGGPHGVGLCLADCEDIYIKDCEAHGRGHSSPSIWGGYDTQGPSNTWTWESYATDIEIDGGNYTSYSKSFDSRSSNDGAAVNLGTDPYTQPDDYTFYVHGVVIDSCPHSGLLVGGLVKAEYCSVYVDVQNTNPLGNSAANAHSMGGKLYPGSWYKNNHIVTGNNHLGGRGMYLGKSVGASDSTIEISNNYIDVTEGETGERHGARGIRLRWGAAYLRIHDNEIHVFGDNHSATDHIGNAGGHGIWLSALGEESSDTSHHNWFYNNQIYSFYDSTGGEGSIDSWETGCLIVEQVGKDSYGFGNGNKSYNNHFYSNIRLLQIGDYNGGGAEWVSYRDTLELDSSTYPYCADSWVRCLVGVGSGTTDCSDNLIIDPILVGFDTSEYANRGSSTSQREIFSQRSYEVHVKDSQGSKVVGATVHIWPKQTYADSTADGEAVCNKNTDGDGNVKDSLSLWYVNYQGPIDSSYNDYRVRAVYDGDTAWGQFTLANSTVTEGGYVADTLTLAGTQDVNKVLFQNRVRPTGGVKPIGSIWDTVQWAYLQREASDGYYIIRACYSDDITSDEALEDFITRWWNRSPE